MLNRFIFGLFLSTITATAAAQASSSKTAFVNEIKDAATFTSFSAPSTGIIRQGETLKFFIDRSHPSRPDIYYINTNFCPTSHCSGPVKEVLYHYHFAKKYIRGFAMAESDFYENAYNTTTLDERRYFDGRIQKFTVTKDGIDQTYYAVRFIERDLANQDIIRFTLEMVRKSLQIPKSQVAFIINSLAQKVDQIEAWAAQENISIFTMEEILSGVDYIGLNPGTAYGFLRYAPTDPDDLEGYEIAVFENMPLELSVVAGTITTQFQDAGSHVNLKSKERGTPNMVLRNLGEIATLKGLEGQPVKLTVGFEGYRIEPSTAEVVHSEYAKKLPSRWQKPAYVPVTQFVHFDDMCPKAAKDCLDKAKSYGGKVAGLGFLAHPKVVGMNSPIQKKLGYRLTPLGFGVPLTAYKEFVQYNSDKSPDFKQALTSLIDSEMSRNGLKPLPTAQKKALIATVKELFLKAEFPQATYIRIFNELSELKARVAAQYPGVDLNKLKIRSSANTEDIDGFNGAGLHDSYSAKIKKSSADDYNMPCTMELEIDDDTGLAEEKPKPNTVACAIKAVYASLWTLRAVRERSFRRFDHSEAVMGLSIQPSYKFRSDIDIVANSVLITRVMGTESVYGHQLSTQVGNGLVTNPVEGTRAELAVISFSYTINSVGINVLQYAKPVANAPALTTMVLPEDKVLLHSEIAKAVETPYCEATPGYYVQCRTVGNSAKKKYALDMEFKTYSNGEILVKQARLYSGK